MAINLACDATRRENRRRLERLLGAALLLDALWIGSAELWTRHSAARLRAEENGLRARSAALQIASRDARRLERQRTALQGQLAEATRRRQQRQQAVTVLLQLERVTPQGVVLQEVSIDATRCRIQGVAQAPEHALRLAEALSGFTPCPARGMAARDGARLPGYAFTLTSGKDTS